MHPIDLRSDTVTRPSLGMRKAMAEAEVGDDVYGEDPTVRRLEEKIADLLGKESALFVPSGTMANQIAIRVHTVPGDEMIIERSGHSFLYESGASAGLSGVQANATPGRYGILSKDDVERAIRPTASHYPRTRLVILENTSNGGGGTIYAPEDIAAIGELTRARQLALHLDGARLFNAHILTEIPLETFARPCDSVSVCLSKGLGAPVGSVLAGCRCFIDEARRIRKMMGGGMRQAGILAAAGLYALENNLERLAEDHENLAHLARGLADVAGVEIDPLRFPTNIAYARITRAGLSAEEAVERLKRWGVLVNPSGPDEIRVVTHLDVSRQNIDEVLSRIERALR